MVDGRYTVFVDTPLGRKPGSVVLRTKGDTFTADIDAPVIGRQKTSGRVSGDTFSAEGYFKMLLVGKVTYKLRGEVKGDDLKIQIKSNKGNFDFVGSRA